MRRKLVAGNWKMNGVRGEARELARALVTERGSEQRVDILVAPPFTALGAVEAVLSGSSVGLAAQNLHPEPKGAFTGEISAVMLKAEGCGSVIIGHSERRQLFGETDEGVRRKLLAATEAELAPIVCVGETLQERDGGRAFEVVGDQVAASLKGVALDASWLSGLVFAYEPVWAIGTGRNATPEQAQEMHRFIRGRLSELVGEERAASTRILYGGSVKPDNAYDLLKDVEIDGALVGGASLQAGSFVAIIDAAVQATAGSA